MSVNPLFKSHI